VLFLTLPTAGSHPDLLENLIQNSGLSRENVVIVVTKQGVNVPLGVTVMEDFGPPNIQRWWNVGIDECLRRGATQVAVLNDDISLNEHSIPALGAALVETGAAIASPSRPPTPDGLYKKSLIPYSPRLWGCFWVLDAKSTLRPDEKYVWWYGDSDLDIRARRDFGGVINVNVYFEHHFPGEGTGANPKLQEQSDRDAVTFQQEYARLLTLTRYVNRVKRFFIHSKV